MWGTSRFLIFLRNFFYYVYILYQTLNKLNKDIDHWVYVFFACAHFCMKIELKE